MQCTELPLGAQVSGTAPPASAALSACTAVGPVSPAQPSSIAFSTCHMPVKHHQRHGQPDG